MSAGHGDATGSNQFDNPERAKDVNERLDFLFLTGNFNNQGINAQVDDFTAENIDQCDDFLNAIKGCDKNQLMAECIFETDIMNGEYGYE